MRKVILANVLVLIAAMVWCEYRTRTLVERALIEQEQREIAFWRELLLPFYRDFGVAFPERPATKAELFAPLIKLTTSLQVYESEEPSQKLPEVSDQKDAEGVSVQDGTAQLNASCRDGILTLQLRNISQSPIVVDKELVFFLHLDFYNTEGKWLIVTSTDPKKTAPISAENIEKLREAQEKHTKEMRDRFVQLKPGEQVVRTIDLHKGYMSFQHSVSGVVGNGAHYSIHSANEAKIIVLPHDSSLGSVEVSYGEELANGFFDMCFSTYTGFPLKEVELYEGPLKVKVRVQ